MGGIHSVYNETLGPQKGNVNSHDFIRKLRGVTTDHAADQKLFVQLLGEWKKEVDLEDRGRRFLQDLPPDKMTILLCTALQQAIDKSGGFASWNQLSSVERDGRNEEFLKALCIELGEGEFGKLSDEEKRMIREMLWRGCCMHKEMNTFKEGCSEMDKYWDDQELPGPMKLMNRGIILPHIIKGVLRKSDGSLRLPSAEQLN